MAKNEFNPRENLKFEDHKTIFENFSAVDGRFPVKYPCFDLRLTPETARFLTDNGFNVPIWDSRDDGPINHIKVNVNFDSKRPPTVRWAKRDPVTGKIKPAQRLTKETLRYLDDYKTIDGMLCDVECRPYSQNNDGNYTLWLVSGIFIVDEDWIDSKYEMADEDYNPEPVPDDPF